VEYVVEEKKEEKKKKPAVKRVRQFVSKDAVVVPLLEEEDHKEIIKELQEHEKKALQIKNISGKKCIICGAEASHHIKGIPQDSYCKECGKEHFKYLNYLEKI
jgi:hypothetical protein